MRVLLLIALLLMIYPVKGAVIHGTVYSWESLEPLPKAIVTINTTPEQIVVAENGTYSFVVPPGTYVIRAYYYSHGELELYDEMNITVKGNGTYVLDLILFPPLNVSEDIPNIQVSLGKEKVESFPFSVLAVLVAVIVCLIGFWWFVSRKRSKKEVESEKIEVKGREELPEDLKKAIEIIKREGGRITQKELRKKLGYSEAKVSLIVADLERRGLVEKVKKGRGNIIFLKE